MPWNWRHLKTAQCSGSLSGNHGIRVIQPTIAVRLSRNNATNCNAAIGGTTSTICAWVTVVVIVGRACALLIETVTGALTHFCSVVLVVAVLASVLVAYARCCRPTDDAAPSWRPCSTRTGTCRHRPRSRPSACSGWPCRQRPTYSPCSRCWSTSGTGFCLLSATVTVFVFTQPVVLLVTWTVWFARPRWRSWQMLPPLPLGARIGDRVAREPLECETCCYPAHIGAHWLRCSVPPAQFVLGLPMWWLLEVPEYW